MRAPIRFEFTVEASHQREAMVAAARALTKNRRYAVIGGALTITLTMLVCLGGIALVSLIAALLGASAGWWVMIGFLGAGGLYLSQFHLLYSELAHSITKRPLNTVPQATTFNEVGMIYEATPAVWSTPWSMIDAILGTKQTITISVAGMAFALPKAAIGDTQAINSLVSDLKEQIANA